MTRIATLRERLGWSQQRMGEHLGVAQSAVFRMENGQRERGPVAKLLDLLEADLEAKGVEAAASAQTEEAAS